VIACGPGGVRHTPPIAEERTEHAYCLDILAFVAECTNRRPRF
jgi:hypothetical protein